MTRDPAVLKKVSVSLPFGLGSAEWEADLTERHAAWSLYVELVTRISVQPLINLSLQFYPPLADTTPATDPNYSHLSPNNRVRSLPTM
ncbi:hypothetical protein D4Z78_01585 [Okeania hirsuta]|nr:hypothetical protein D4Z78_01585 [Okeania hirsuta]